MELLESDCMCLFLNPEPEWASDESSLYVDYVNAFHKDLRYVYRLNGWPNSGTDEQGYPTPWQTIDEVMEGERRKLLPWGGSLGFTWPKLYPWGSDRPELRDFLSFQKCRGIGPPLVPVVRPTPGGDERKVMARSAPIR